MVMVSIGLFLSLVSAIVTDRAQAVPSLKVSGRYSPVTQADSDRIACTHPIGLACNMRSALIL